MPVYEKFRLTDDAIGSAELGHQFIEIDDLLDGIRFDRLLSVSERCIRDPYILRHSDRDAPMVKSDARNVRIGIYIAVEIGLLDILQRIFIRFLFKQVGFL